MTGIREAVITAEMMSAGELTSESYTRRWAQDPYDPAYQGVERRVLRFLSDDERDDARFPQHPLSKVRRVLAGIPAGATGLQSCISPRLRRRRHEMLSAAREGVVFLPRARRPATQGGFGSRIPDGRRDGPSTNPMPAEDV